MLKHSNHFRRRWAESFPNGGADDSILIGIWILLRISSQSQDVYLWRRIPSDTVAVFWLCKRWNDCKASYGLPFISYCCLCWHRVYNRVSDGRTFRKRAQKCRSYFWPVKIGRRYFQRAFSSEEKMSEFNCGEEVPCRTMIEHSRWCLCVFKITVSKEPVTSMCASCLCKVWLFIEFILGIFTQNRGLKLDRRLISIV